MGKVLDMFSPTKCLFLFFLILAFPVRSQDFSEYDIYYINGMLTPEEPRAQLNRQSIETLLRQLYGDQAITVKLLYNENHGKLIEIIDVFVERNGETGNPNYSTSGFWKSFYGANPPTADYLYAIQYYGIYHEQDVGPYSNADLQKMITKATASLEQGKKVIFVPHSQGNFFYSNIYVALENEDSDVAQSCTQSVGLATPSSNTSGNYNWITNTNDRVVNAVRTLYPTALSANVTVPYSHSVGNGDPNAHGITETYLSHSNSKELFEDYVDIAVSELEDSCENCSGSSIAIWIAKNETTQMDWYQVTVDGLHEDNFTAAGNNCKSSILFSDDYEDYFDGSWSPYEDGLDIHVDALSEEGLSGCLLNWDKSPSYTDHNDYRADLTPYTDYQVELESYFSPNDSIGASGTIYSFQVCNKEVNGKDRPVIRRLLGSHTYSGSTGQDFGPFTFQKTNECLPCDDLNNIGEFPDSKTTVRFETTGGGSCTARLEIDDVYYGTFGATGGGTTSPRDIDLVPGTRDVQLENFSQSCGIGVNFNSFSVSMSVNGQNLGSVGFLGSSTSIVVPVLTP